MKVKPKAPIPGVRRTFSRKVNQDWTWTVYVWSNRKNSHCDYMLDCVRGFPSKILASKDMNEKLTLLGVGKAKTI